MKLRDFMGVTVAFTGCVIGFFLVPFYPWMDPIPFYTLWGSLYVAFVPLDMGVTTRLAWRYKGAFVVFTIARHFILPGIVFGAFWLLMPDFALAALLLAGASIAVNAPFMAMLIGTDIGMATVLGVVSSALVPFSLPVLVDFFVGARVEISRSAMMFTLAQMIIVPTVASVLTRYFSPWLTRKVTEQGYFWGLAMVFLSSVTILSKYAPDLVNEPQLVRGCFIAAFGVMVMLIIVGLL
ncbi:MAG: hypothetical protein LBR29_12275 [Methylobacteriaceae bacterium]|jgi:BASS family bile acid:Na+ symporter|nr:hypothetical protein [Methylobacteriaceae bacterium]